jgi:putative iron-dependent peroxidase
MRTPQGGIFALGTPSHAYLEFDLLDRKKGRELVAAISSFREPRTTMGGVNLVVGFRPELWAEVAPDDAPSGVEGFNHDIVGIEGFTMPATQHDAVLWLAGSAYDVIFDISREAINELKELATVADETSRRPYQHFRDLTGFVDGTENPSLVEAPGVVLMPEAVRERLVDSAVAEMAADTGKWEALPVAEQKLGSDAGRRTARSENKPAYAHAARTDQDEFGKIFRRNMPYGTVTNHGTMFVGFSAEQKRLSTMLESMAGKTTGVRDALTKYTKPISGAYYFVPCAQRLRQPTEDDENVLQAKTS